MIARNSVFHFEAEGVTAYLRDQKRALKFTRIDDNDIEHVDGTFQPKRLVINIGAIEDNGSGEYIKTFEPPLELHVRFTPCDVLRARDAGSLEPVLAYWYGKTWIPFTDKHEFTLYYGPDCDFGGVGVVKIKHWGDPWIAWGP